MHFQTDNMSEKIMPEISDGEFI